MIDDLPATEAYVYMVYQTDPPYVKIGNTEQEPNQRLSDLQNGNPRELKFFYKRRVPTKECAEHIEKKLHRLYADCWVRGEWFRLLPSPGLQAQLDNMADEAIEYFELFDRMRRREEALQQNPQFRDWQRGWRTRLLSEHLLVEERQELAVSSNGRH